MTPSARPTSAELQALLFPQGAASPSVWAVWDGARSTQVHRMLLTSRLEVRTLFDAPVAHAVARAGPQLVEVPYGHRLLADWLAHAWQAHWGVLLRSDDPNAVRHHLSRLLKVRASEPRPQLFRFYDPRVLRALLPRGEPVPWSAFFGPVQTWFAVDDAGALQAFEGRGGQGVRSRTLWSPPAAGSDAVAAS
ncbi:MAG: DUF4123 domain-containing protein [Rubrivivax sp.]|jgi:hypothetical protein